MTRDEMKAKTLDMCEAFKTMGTQEIKARIYSWVVSFGRRRMDIYHKYAIKKANDELVRRTKP